MADWNPAQYLKFERDRNKPIADLLNHVRLENPARIIDIGCGPGNSTGFLARRWPGVEVVGLDSSKAMLEKARQGLPGVEWIEQDATQDLSPLGGFDLVFSNAALQWLPEHERVIPNWFGLLKPGGVLAVQLPHNFNNPVHLALRDMAKAWRLTPPPSRFYPAGFYYDILAECTDEFELWTTIYYHVMHSHEDIIEWYKGTGLRPYLDQLNEQDSEAFLADMLAQVRQLYPVQTNGNILFDFERLFFVAENNKKGKST